MSHSAVRAINRTMKLGRTRRRERTVYPCPETLWPLQVRRPTTSPACYTERCTKEGGAVRPLNVSSVAPRRRRATKLRTVTCSIAKKTPPPGPSPSAIPSNRKSQPMPREVPCPPNHLRSVRGARRTPMPSSIALTEPRGPHRSFSYAG